MEKVEEQATVVPFLRGDSVDTLSYIPHICSMCVRVCGSEFQANLSYI